MCGYPVAKKIKLEGKLSSEETREKKVYKNFKVFHLNEPSPVHSMLPKNFPAPLLSSEQ